MCNGLHTYTKLCFFFILIFWYYMKSVSWLVNWKVCGRKLLRTNMSPSSTCLDVLRKYTEDLVYNIGRPGQDWKVGPPNSENDVYPIDLNARFISCNSAAHTSSVMVTSCNKYSQHGAAHTSSVMVTSCNKYSQHRAVWPINTHKCTYSLFII